MKDVFSVLEDSPLAPAPLPTRGPGLFAVERRAVRHPTHRPLKILAAIDLLENSKGAIDHAIEIAGALGAQLSLLNVVNSNSRSREVTPCQFDSALPENIGRWVVEGRVPETIASCAEFGDVDLVLMASNHHRAWKHLWKRSVTAQVMASTSRPVLVTAVGDEESRFRCRRILCAIAPDEADESTVLQAEALARRSGGELILLGIVPEIDEAMLYKAWPGEARPLSSRLAADRLRKIATSLSASCKTLVMIGSQYRCIGLAARQCAADMVVVSRSGMEMRLFRRLTCPVLSVARAASNSRARGPQLIAHAGNPGENAGDSWR